MRSRSVLKMMSMGPFTIKNTEKCSFEPTPLPPKTSPSVANFGSQIPRSKIDWSTGKAAGNKCDVKCHLQYSDSAQLKGIKPDKPALYLTNSMNIKKGKVYAVIWCVGGDVRCFA